MADENSSPQGGRSLGGGASEPLPSTWVRPSTQPRIGRIGDWSGSDSNSGPSANPGGSGSRFGSLRDITGGGGTPSGPAPPSDDDEEEDPNRQESWFTGGERSGLSVQNPDAARRVPGGRMVRDLLRRAAEAGPAPEESSRSQAFFGGGHTLGSTDSGLQSQHIPDPNAPEQDMETAVRRLTFWRDGFTVEDGDLMRYDDPNNSELLAEINEGRAPPQILNVQPGQPVELRVSRRTDENWVPSTRSQAFAGSGNRLGNPVPEIVSGGIPIAGGMPGGYVEAGTSSTSAAGTSTNTADAVSAKFEVDHDKPTTSVQIRLADGTKMTCRMNLTHTVLDLRNFINASRPENLTRPYTIGTTFPKRLLDKNDETIEAAGLKNSVVVQRWA